MVVGPGVISNSRTFGRSFGVSQIFFFLVIKALPVSPINTKNNLYREFYTRCWSAIPSEVGILELGTDVVEW